MESKKETHRDLVLRLIFIASILFLVQFQGFGFYVGDRIDHPLLYGLLAGYTVFVLLSAWRPDLWSYQGKLGSKVAFIDLVGLFAVFFATGGLESNLYLMLGVVPLIAGVYFGTKVALLTGVWESAAMGLVIVLDKLVFHRGEVTENLRTLVALRYFFIAGATVFDTYITDILIKERNKLNILYRTSLSSTSGPALTNVVGAILDVVAEIFRLEKACILLFDEATGELKVQQPARGIDDRELIDFYNWIREGENVSRAFSQKEVAVFNRSQIISELGARLPCRGEAKSFIVSPLITRGKCIGYITGCNIKRERGFTRREIQLMEMVSSNVAIYLENALLYLKSEENVAQLSSLIRVVDAIGSISTMENIYNFTMDVMKGLFATDMALLIVIDQHTGALQLVKSYGISEDFLATVGRELVQELEEYNLIAGDQVILNGELTREKQYPRLLLEEGIRSMMSVPIKSGDQVYGTLHLASRYLQAFTKKDISLAHALGEEMGMALERTLLFEEVNRFAITDALTGLYNRYYLANILEEEIQRAQRYARPLSFIMMDIDHFKVYNDLHGHPRGDEVLRTLAGILRENTRNVDTVFRYGGEEFFILAPEINKVEAAQLADRLRQLVMKYPFPFEEAQPEGDLTISLGVSSFPLDGNEGSQLIDKADQALYRAKKMGRNRVCIYSGEAE